MTQNTNMIVLDVFDFFVSSRTNNNFLIPFFCTLGALNKSTARDVMLSSMAMLQRVGG